MDAQQYLLQRLRWARGAMQVWSRESILTSKQLTFMQKLCYLTSIVTYFEGWQTLIIFLLPIVSLLTGWLPLTVGGTSFPVIFTLWFATGVWLNELLGRGSAKTFWMLDFQFVRCFMFARATLALIIKRQWTFAVTPKSKKDSAPNTNQLPGVPVAMTVLAVASLPAGIALYMYAAHLTLTALILNLFWTTVNIVIAVRALSRVRSFSVERRDSYRFQIPVPLTLLVTSDKSFLCSAIDLSRDGARIEVPTGLLMPDKIEGVLHLPSADVPFSGVVRRLKPSADRRVNYVSIQFEWPDQKSADPVSYLLFGNPAQWELYRTPEERAHIVTTGHVDPHRFKRWHPARMVVDGAPDHFCLIEQQRGGHDVLRVLTYAKPVQDIGVMHLKPLHSEQRSANMFISETHHVLLNYGNIYVMFVVPDRRISRESNPSRPAALKGTLR
jgi:cellulose synthase (UDP-forming)